MSRQYTKVMILVDTIWRLANAIPNSYSSSSGDIEVELNGLIVLAKGGYWFEVDESLSDEKIYAIASQSNIEQLFCISAQKQAHKKAQDRLAKQQRQADQVATLLAQQAVNSQPVVVVEQPPIVGINGVANDFMDFIDENPCDCVDCQHDRGEL